MSESMLSSVMIRLMNTILVGSNDKLCLGLWAIKLIQLAAMQSSHLVLRKKLQNRSPNYRINIVNMKGTALGLSVQCADSTWKRRANNRATAAIADRTGWGVSFVVRG